MRRAFCFLCSELKKLAVNMNIDDITKKNHFKDHLVKSEALQELLNLLQGGGSGEHQQ
jgi:hypothetical protein